MTKNMSHKTTGSSAVKAGLALLGMAILAPIAHFGIFGSMIVDGDAAGTLENVTDNPGLFFFAGLLLFAVVVLDVIVALALRDFFKATKLKMVGYMSGLRIIYAAVFAVAIAYLVVPALQILAGMTVSVQDMSNGTLIFNTVWDGALILFAGHLILLGWLFYRVKYTPTWIAPFLAIAGLGYGIDSIGRLFTDSYTIEIATIAFVGEVILIFWLLIKGRKVAAER